MTGQNLINAALQRLGQLDAGEAPSASESNFALDSLNRLIARWNTDATLLYTRSLVTVNLSSGTASYALGTRPARIEAANAVYPLPGGEVKRAPLKILPAALWAQVPNKNMTSATLQDGVLYCDYGYTTATIYVAPIPTFTSGTHSVELYTLPALTQFALLSTDNNYPDGYLNALIAALAYDLMSSYGVPQTMAAQIKADYDESLATLRSLNTQVIPPPPEQPQQ